MGFIVFMWLSTAFRQLTTYRIWEAIKLFLMILFVAEVLIQGFK
jgi:hypothetical protein